MAIWDWIVQNKEWVFSGIGVFILGLAIALFRRKKSTSETHHENIVTHGDQSPGKVMGNYEARSDERQTR